MKTFLLIFFCLIVVNAYTDAPACTKHSDCVGSGMCCGTATPVLSCIGRICYGTEQQVCLKNTMTQYKDSSEFYYTFKCLPTINALGINEASSLTRATLATVASLLALTYL